MSYPQAKKPEIKKSLVRNDAYRALADATGHSFDSLERFILHRLQAEEITDQYDCDENGKAITELPNLHQVSPEKLARLIFGNSHYKNPEIAALLPAIILWGTADQDEACPYCGSHTEYVDKDYDEEKKQAIDVLQCENADCMEEHTVKSEQRPSLSGFYK